jgi:hypothetical protein
MNLRPIFIWIVLVCLVSNACEDQRKFIYLDSFNKIPACGVDDPVNEVSWLHEKILESYNEKNFVEYVWVKDYAQEDLFIVSYILSSVMYECYNCRGDRVFVPDSIKMTIYTLHDSEKIYKDKRAF